MTVDEWKKQKAEILKAFYNNLWTKAIEANNGIITYLDMVKIADIIHRSGGADSGFQEIIIQRRFLNLLHCFSFFI